MQFPQPLARGRLVRRYKRFFADVVLDEGGPVTAHIANPGKLLGLLNEGGACWLSRSDAPGRKLAWSVELIEAENGSPVAVNTALANRVAAEGLNRVPQLAGYPGLRREVRYGSGRIDLLLEGEGRPPCWVEVKSVTLSRRPGLAEWPDCVSSRTSRQLRELAEVVERGDRAALLFLLGRSDCDRFSPAADLDPAFAAALSEAQARGVEVLCHAADVGPESVTLAGPLPITSA